MKCPGKDTQQGKPDDIFELKCPVCSHSVEFFKDDPFQRCSECGYFYKNPRRKQGCAEWCAHAGACKTG
jgi:hypothetical protein